MAMDQGVICASCNTFNKRKRTIQCASCNLHYHLSCVGLSKVQALALARWSCGQCRGLVVAPARRIGQVPDLEFVVSHCRPRFRVLLRIPKGAVIHVAGALQNLLSRVLEQRSQIAWGRLMSFCYLGIQCPSKEQDGHHLSLATKIRQQVTNFMESESLPDLSSIVAPTFNRRNAEVDTNAQLRKRVAAKFADSDIRGAVRELASSDGLAPHNEATLEALKAKHPSSPVDLSLPAPPNDDLVTTRVATEAEVRKAIESFRPGSAGGPDGLRPGHLRTLIGLAAGEAGARLLTTLTSFVNMVLRGEVPDFATSTFFGASLCALSKKDRSVRPIAVGNTLRRLATKVGALPLTPALGEELRPVQLGFSTKGGCEAAVHAARRYLSDGVGKRVLLKIDMRNAFNCLRRDTFLSAARSRVPGLYRLLWQAYASPSALFYGEDIIRSATGIQQGDPFGPALFSLGIDEIARSVSSHFNVWYLDDATLGDSPEKVLGDVRLIVERLEKIGLEVNSEKCELTLLNLTSQEESDVEAKFREVLTNVRLVQASHCSLLGAPLSNDGIPETLEDKIRGLENMVGKLEVIDNHQALVLLRSCFAIPKLQYILRASPAYNADEIRKFDDTLREAVSKVTNVALSDEAWLQATLPVELGGLGVRRAGDIALPAFVSSLHSVGDLVETILVNINMVETRELASAVAVWGGIGGGIPAPVENTNKQKAWDIPLAKLVQERLVDESDQVGRARLLAAACNESGAWLNAVPVPSLGTQLDPDVLRVAVALRVGSRICETHSCRCGGQMDERGHHGLSCRYSAGRHPRHSALNDIVKRGLLRAGLPSVLEPPGLDRGDGKRPDGLTVYPFKEGRSLVWDCTCVDTFARTHLNNSAITARSAACAAEALKRTKYSGLAGRYLFEPIAVETTGVYGDTTASIVHEIGRRIVVATGDPRESAWFRQRLSIAIQRGNAFSILAAGREFFSGSGQF